MNDKQMDAMKVRQYVFEKNALEDFLKDHADNYNFHVKNAITHRLGIINREMGYLSPAKKRRNTV